MKRAYIIIGFILIGFVGKAQLDSTYFFSIGTDAYQEYHKGLIPFKKDVVDNRTLKSIWMPSIGIYKYGKMAGYNLSVSYGWGQSKLLNEHIDNQLNTIKSKYRNYRTTASVHSGFRRIGLHLGLSLNHQKTETEQSLFPNTSSQKTFLSYAIGIQLHLNNNLWMIPITYERYNGYNLIGTSFHFPVFRLNRIF